MEPPLEWPAALNAFAWLSKSQFSDAFKAQWDCTTESFLKVEAGPVFVEDGDAGFEEFVSGNVTAAKALVQERVLRQADMYSEAIERGARIERVRVVGRPLTPYLRDYELAAYEVVPSIGESVTFVSEASIDDADQPWCRDFMVFDQRAALVHQYTPWGRMLGGWITEDAATVSELWELWHRLRLLATSEVPET